MIAIQSKPLFARACIAVAMSLALAACALAPDGGRDAEAAARQYLVAGDTARAIERLERAHLEARRDPELFTTLGSLYRSRGDINGRLRSQRLLERAQQLFPGDATVLMELGRTYYAQTFYPDAERSFRSALELDSTLCDARYFLGVYHYDKWKRINAYTDDLERACGEFADAYTCDPGNADAARRYAYSLYALGLPDSALSVCDSFIARAPDRPEFYLLRGAVAYDRQHYDTAAEDFDAGLDRVDPQTRAAYRDIGDFIPAADRSAYARAAPDVRDAYDRAFWVDADPDPTTTRNERALEHVYRTFLADLFYSCPHPSRRGWETERGQTFIKFGRPDSLESNMGDSYKDGRVETWTYEIGDAVLEFVFVDEYLNGNLRIPYRADALVSVLRYDPMVSDYEPEAADVPGDIDVVAFKDTDMSATLYITLRVDADSLAGAADLDHTNHFYLRGVLFDERWRAESRFADTLWTSETPAYTVDDSLRYDVLRAVSVPFDTYHIACTFQDSEGRAAAQLRTDGDTHRFAGDALALSDILLEAPGDSAAVLVRGGRTLRPNTGHRYRAAQRLSAYVEVYNLRVTQRKSDYSVTFSIYESPAEAPPAWRRWGSRLAAFVGAEGDPSISQTFQRSGRSHRDVEVISINIDTLPEGRYELVVTVEDKASGERADTRTWFSKTAQE